MKNAFVQVGDFNFTGFRQLDDEGQNSVHYNRHLKHAYGLEHED